MIDAVATGAGSVQEHEELVRLVVRARRIATWFFRRQRIPEEDAEDLIQQTLLVLVVKRHEIRNPDAWVIGTLRNKCRRYWRSRREQRVDRLEDESLRAPVLSLPPEQERADVRRDLELALSRLPERCRLVLRYRYGLGFRASEVAELMKCPAATVRKTASRCLRALQRELGAQRVE